MEVLRPQLICTPCLWISSIRNIIFSNFFIFIFKRYKNNTQDKDKEFWALILWFLSMKEVTVARLQKRGQENPPLTLTMVS